jgi:hypothetical protein
MGVAPNLLKNPPQNAAATKGDGFTQIGGLQRFEDEPR